MNPKYMHGLTAVVAYRGGKKAEAKQHLEAIDYDVKSSSAEFYRYVNLEAMMADLRK